MALAICKEEELTKRLESTKNSLCDCIHCQGIRRQQYESEIQWIKGHRLFDR